MSQSPRPRLSLCITLFLLASVESVAEVIDCDRLAGSQRALCNVLARCTFVEDADRRAACFSDAIRVGTVIESEGAVEPSDAVVESQETATTGGGRPGIIERRVPPSRTARRERRVEPEEPQPASRATARTDAAPAGRAAAAEPAPAPAEEEISTFGRLVRMFSRDKQKEKRDSEAGISSSFTAVVKDVRELVRDRQLVLLENDLLFEGTGPLFRIGDTVDVFRTKFGGSYSMTDTRGGRREVRRLRCESGKLARDVRRKCRLVLGTEAP